MHINTGVATVFVLLPCSAAAGVVNLNRGGKYAGVARSGAAGGYQVRTIRTSILVRECTAKGAYVVDVGDE